MSLITLLENEGLEITKNSFLKLGKYDVLADKFIDTTPSKVVEDFMKVALIKVHYAKNKGYQIASLY